MNRENHGTPYVAQRQRLKAPIDRHVVSVVAILQHLLESVMVAFGEKHIQYLARIETNFVTRRKVKCMSQVLKFGCSQLTRAFALR